MRGHGRVSAGGRAGRSGQGAAASGCNAPFDVFSRIIDRNTTLPVQRSQVFTTAANVQTSVDIHVLQGEREIASCNKTLGRFRLTGIRRALRGIPQIEVTFSIDANGIVNVSAKDLGTGKHQEITLTQSTHMSDAEIEQAMRDAERYAAEDDTDGAVDADFSDSHEEKH